MKKVLGILLMVAFLLCGALSIAQALAKTDIPELKMSMDIPDNWIIFKRTVDANDPNLARTGMDKTELEQLFIQKNIYLNAIDPNKGNEIVVTMTQSDSVQEAFDLNLLNEREIRHAANDFKESNDVKNAGFTLTDYVVYKTRQAIFVDYDRYYMENEKKFYGKQYFTVINGQAIHIIYNSRSTQPLTAEETALIKNTIDSIVFTEVMKKPFDMEAVYGGVLKAGIVGIAVGVIIGVIRKLRKKKSAPSTDKSGYKRY